MLSHSVMCGGELSLSGSPFFCFWLPIFFFQCTEIDGKVWLERRNRPVENLRFGHGFELDETGVRAYSIVILGGLYIPGFEDPRKEATADEQ